MGMFLFNLFNHGEMGQRSLEDVIGIFGHQLRALGHTAVWNVANDKFVTAAEGWNVIVEGFTPESIGVIAEAHNNGARFLILATEEPTERGFNHGTSAEMIMRQRTFAEGARFCDGIFHLVPGDGITAWYKQHAPAAYVELGYAPTLIRPADGIDPDYDFGFFGSVSPRRLALLKRLARRAGTEKAVKIVGDFATQADRDRDMRRAKVILQIRKFDAMGLVSSSRCNTALSIGRPVVAEPHALSKPWDEVVHFSKSEDAFISDALAMRGMWKGIHAGQFRRFVDKFSPEVCVGAALRKIGLDHLAGAA